MKTDFGPPVHVIKTRCPTCHTQIWTTHRGPHKCHNCHIIYDIVTHEVDAIITHPDRRKDAK